MILSSVDSSNLPDHQPSMVMIADPTPQPQHEEHVNNPNICVKQKSFKGQSSQSRAC